MGNRQSRLRRLVDSFTFIALFVSFGFAETPEKAPKFGPSGKSRTIQGHQDHGRQTSSRAPSPLKPSRPSGKTRNAVPVTGQSTTATDEVASLKSHVAHQQKQIEELLRTVNDLKQRLDGADWASHAAVIQTSDLGQLASLRPAISVGPVAATEASAKDSFVLTANAPAAAGMPPVTRSEMQEYTTKVEDLGKKVDGALKNLGGFKFSGDFRFRADAQLRSSNAIAGPLQNLRSRYRLRLNVDKELDPRFRFRMQLSTGPLNNGLTNDQDFAGTVVKHPFSIAEAYVDFHPNSNFALRGGRMEEVFADSMRFLWDDDIRFNGFQQIVAIPVESNLLGIKSIELRGGEYIFSNPNVLILPAPSSDPSKPSPPTSAFVSAGFQPGKKVRDANLFHPGFVVKGDLRTGWSHQLTGDIQVYRNPNEIQLASLASGFPVLVSNGIGLTLSGPMTGTGNATTTPGGAIFSAPNFQIARAAYRLEHKGWKLGNREMLAYLDFQASRNIGTSRLRDAVMVSANAGTVKGFGDVRFLYQFAIKDANSLISQFTDDDLGTGTGVNIRVHAVRFDLGLTRFLQWQNLLFIQDERRPSNPNELFFVPLQRGANTTFRYLGQLAFTF